MATRSSNASLVAIGALVLLAGGIGFVALSTATKTKSSPDQPLTPPPPTPSQLSKLEAQVGAVLDLKRDQQWTQAKALLDELIVSHPAEQVLYIQRAEVFVGLNQPAQAHDDYDKALALGPREGELEFAAGTAANAAERLERAVEHYQAAQASLQNDYRPPLYLAQVLIKLNRTDEAKVALRRVQMMKPDEPIAYGTMAEIFLRDNAPDLALQTVAQARRLQPDYLPWKMVEARALKRKAQPQQALDLLVSLSDAQKLEPGVLGLIGECFGMLRKPADAAAVFVHMAEQFPERGELALEAALWLERAGDKAKAKTFAQRASFLAVEGADEVLARVSD